MPQSSLEARLRAVEDRLAIYNLLATHPLTGDAGDPSLIESVYTDDLVVERGSNLDGANGRDSMVALLGRDEHLEAIAGGLAHFGNLPLVDVDGDTAVALSYIALITPDSQGQSREVPNHGTSTGYRIHRVVANRWSLQRGESGWRIAARTMQSIDGEGPAVELIRQAGRHHIDSDAASSPL
jgi:SnoaL-like domain